jgi:RNA polymerase sigma-70 factor (ECF subfamily)
MDSLNVEDTKDMNGINGEIFEVNDKFYDRYNPHIRKIAARILTSAGQGGYIDDCVNEVFLQLIERLQQYNETRGSMAAFVTIITRSAALNFIKSTARKTGELIGDDTIAFLTEPSSFENEVEGKIEYERLVKSILEKLDKKESVLFTMRFILFYPPEEIAKALKITRNAVDGRINNLKNKIKRFLIKGGVTI